VGREGPSTAGPQPAADQMFAATASSWSGSKPNLLSRCRGADVLVVWALDPGVKRNHQPHRSGGLRELFKQAIKAQPSFVDHHGHPMLHASSSSSLDLLFAHAARSDRLGIPPRRASKQFSRLNGVKVQAFSEATRALSTRPAVGLWRHRAQGRSG